MKRGSEFIWGGVILMVIAAIFGWRTTVKFGGNDIPGSVEEAITDLIVVLQGLTGFVLVVVGKYMSSKEK